ncbi:MAG: hypothetical protein WD942_03020 [Dehalococcoidia bacterium]
MAMFQVRVSLWTWGFKSPLAHKLVQGFQHPEHGRIAEPPRTPRTVDRNTNDLISSSVRTRCKGDTIETMVAAVERALSAAELGH